MGHLPNPAIELGGGTKTLVSGASDIDIPKTLILAFFIPYMLWNFARLFDIRPTTIVCLFMTFYRSLINLPNSICTLSRNLSRLYLEMNHIHINIHIAWRADPVSIAAASANTPSSTMPNSQAITVDVDHLPSRSSTMAVIPWTSLRYPCFRYASLP